jgi:acyl carrier protein
MTTLATPGTIDAALRELLADVGRLRADAKTLDAEDDLYAAGLSSLATVDLMLAIEDRFSIEFPEARLNRRTFGSISAIRAAVEAAQGGTP